MIFNYAPGYEEEDARNIYKELGCPERIKIDIQASSLRQLAALCANCSFYFGNEGGARHIAQALGVPSFAIIHQVHQNQCGYPPIPYLPKESVLTTFFRRNNKRH